MFPSDFVSVPVVIVRIHYHGISFKCFQRRFLNIINGNEKALVSVFGDGKDLSLRFFLLVKGDGIGLILL